MVLRQRPKNTGKGLKGRGRLPGALRKTEAGENADWKGDRQGDRSRPHQGLFTPQGQNPVAADRRPGNFPPETLAALPGAPPHPPSWGRQHGAGNAGAGETRSFSPRSTFSTSPVMQRSRIRLPIQRTRVQSQVWEDPTDHGETNPRGHGY